MIIKPVFESVLKYNNLLLGKILLIKYNAMPHLVKQCRPMSGFTSQDMYRTIIGNREIVGYGINGTPGYCDTTSFPFPAIRYSVPLSEFVALKEKEKGDWRLLSVEEKRALYRYNFCQTFAEFKAPTGEWRFVLGGTLMVISVGIWLYCFQKAFICGQVPLPTSLNHQREQCARLINIHSGPITGISSHWDYERMKWKKKPWYIIWDDPFNDEYD